MVDAAHWSAKTKKNIKNKRQGISFLVTSGGSNPVDPILILRYNSNPY